MTGQPTKPMALWQTRPCAPWCDRPHPDDQPTDDRPCANTDPGVVLTLENALRHGGKVWPDTAYVTLEQGPQEAAPHVEMWTEHGDHNRLTLDEAERLAMRLMAQVRAARAGMAAQNGGDQ